MTMPKWLPLVLVAALAGWLGWRLKPAPNAEPVVVLPDSVLMKDRPKPTLTLPQRITTRTVKPTQVATSEGTPDTARVRRYCAPQVVDHDNPRDTNGLTPQTPEKQGVRSTPLFPPFAGRTSKHRLELHATRSDGSLWRGTYAIGSKAEWVATDTSVVVHTPRRLFGILSLEPGAAIEGEWYPVSSRLTGRAAFTVGDDRQVRAGLNEHADPFVGFHAEF